MSVFELELEDPLPNGNNIKNYNEDDDGVFDYSDDEKLASKKEHEFYHKHHGNEDDEEIKIENEFIEGYSTNLIDGENYITSKDVENLQRKQSILDKEFEKISQNNVTNGIDGINVKIRSDLKINSTDDLTQDEEELIPPENFSPVIGKIYRSSFPRSENFKFLDKLGLKSILILIPEEYPQENIEFVTNSNIKIFQVGMSGNKEPFVKISHDLLTKALEIAINPENHPLLIHCNRGKHRTGCLVGCIRRLQKWSLTMILDEYRRFAAPKIRPLDQQFIEMYNEEEIIETATENGWIPLSW